MDLVDMEMSARFTDAHKIAPAEVATRTIDGLERGLAEVLVDDSSRTAKGRLAGPVTDLVAQR